MNKNITKLYRTTACALAITLLTSCSDDLTKEQSNDQVAADKRTTLDGLSLAETGTTLPSEPNSSETLDSTPQKAHHPKEDESAEELKFSNDAQEEAYEAPSKIVSFSSTSNDGVIKWDQPQGTNYSSTKISISNQSGETIVRNFNNGESMELYGELPDGLYKWKSVVSPRVDEYVRKEMREVRSLGNINAERELIARLRAEGSLPTEKEARDNVQSGSFIVVNGVASPSEVDGPTNEKQ